MPGGISFCLGIDSVVHPDTEKAGTKERTGGQAL